MNRFYKKELFFLFPLKISPRAKKILLPFGFAIPWLLGGEKIPKKRDDPPCAVGQTHKHTRSRKKEGNKKAKKKDTTTNNNNRRHLLRCNLERDDDTIIIAVDDNGASALSADELDEE